MSKKALFALVALLLANGQFSVAIFGEETVYVGGSRWNEQVRGYDLGYWRNGTWHTVEPGSKEYYNGVVWAIAKAGDDVYVAGSKPANKIDPKNAVLSNLQLPGYWKNDQWHALEIGKNFGGGIRDLCIDGTDVYIVGWIVDKSLRFFHGGYWKNGVWKELAKYLPYNFTEVMTRIKVNGRDVYVKGGVADSAGVVKAGYWKNDVWFVPKPDTKQDQYAWDGFDVSNNRFVWVGRRNGEPGYLYNDAWVSLPPPEGGGDFGVKSIFLSGSDVYALGYYKLNKGYWVSGYWKNGVWQSVSQPFRGISLGLAVFQDNVYLNVNDETDKIKGGLLGKIAGYYHNDQLIEFQQPVPAGKEYLGVEDGCTCIIVVDE